jgi:integrase
VQEKLQAALRDQREGRLVIGTTPTASQFLAHWLDVSRAAWRPKTYTSYEGTVRLHIAPALGRVRLDKLTPVHVQRLLKERRDAGLSARSVQYVLHVLRIALGKAVRWGLVQRNVAALVDGPRVPRRRVAALDPGQAQRFIAAAGSDRLRALYTVALSLGLRQGEALGLRWSDVDLEGRSLTVRVALQRVPGRGLTLVEPKTGTSQRRIALPGVCVDALRAHRVRQLEERLPAGPAWIETDLVFTTMEGRALDGGAVTKNLQRILARCGLPRLRFHDLRHSAASLLGAQGVPARVVMEVLGHSRISVTMDLYSHVFPSALGAMPVH